MPKLDRSTGIYACVLAAIACTFAFGVLWLTPVDQRGDLLRTVGGPIGGLVSAVAALVAAKVAQQAKSATHQQNETLDTIKRNTNGALTGGILDAVNQALDAREAAAAQLAGRHAVVVPVAPLVAGPDPLDTLTADPAGASL